MWIYCKLVIVKPKISIVRLRNQLIIINTTLYDQIIHHHDHGLWLIISSVPTNQATSQTGWFNSPHNNRALYGIETICIANQFQIQQSNPNLYCSNIQGVIFWLVTQLQLKRNLQPFQFLGPSMGLKQYVSANPNLHCSNIQGVIFWLVNQLLVKSNLQLFQFLDARPVSLKEIYPL